MFLVIFSLKNKISIILILYGSTASAITYHRPYKQLPVHKVMHGIGELIVDAAYLNASLFSVTSAKIMTAFTPAYLATRFIDEPLQNNFYDRTCHKNIHQFPASCHAVAKYGVGIPMVFLSSMALWAPDPEVRLTARMFAIGLPFVHSGKDIIKQCRFKSCLRPWHQDFSAKKRSSGGFPSGHMANVTFMATLFGMRHGPAWAVPLGLFAGFVFADFLNCNRHYISQLVAGAGLGVLFAFAALHVIEKKISDRCAVAYTLQPNGLPLLKGRYCF